MPNPVCPYSGLTIRNCQASDLCDCFDFPQEDTEHEKQRTAERITRGMRGIREED